MNFKAISLAAALSLSVIGGTALADALNELETMAPVFHGFVAEHAQADGRIQGGPSSRCPKKNGRKWLEFAMNLLRAAAASKSSARS